MDKKMENSFTQTDFDKTLSQLFELMADEEEKGVLDIPSTDPLMTDQQKQYKIDQKRQELQEACARFTTDHNWLRGVEAIVDYARLSSPAPDASELAQEWESLPQLITNMIEGEIAKEASLQAVLKLSDPAMEIAYQAALEQYDRKDYALAIQILSAIQFFNANYFDSWMLQGVCWQELKQWQASLASFSMAILLEAKESLPYAYSAYSYHHLGQSQMAEEFLHLAKNLRPSKDEQTLIDYMDQALRVKKQS